MRGVKQRTTCVRQEQQKKKKTCSFFFCLNGQNAQVCLHSVLEENTHSAVADVNVKRKRHTQLNTSFYIQQSTKFKRSFFPPLFLSCVLTRRVSQLVEAHRFLVISSTSPHQRTPPKQHATTSQNTQQPTTLSCTSVALPSHILSSSQTHTHGSKGKKNVIGQQTFPHELPSSLSRMPSKKKKPLQRKTDTETVRHRPSKS